MTTHLHITTWVVALILFAVALILHNSGKAKATKIVQMILRVFYLLVLFTGIQLFLNIEPSGGYHIKMLFGILVIAFLEMVLIRVTKGKSSGLFWGLLAVSLVVTFYYGLSLPMGWWIIR